MTQEIRGSFSRIRAFTDEIHKELGTTASMRSIIEAIAEQGEQPVPQIAKLKGVSRQYVQVNVDALLDAKLVKLRDNPLHRRSPLIALTPKGRSAVKQMRRRERTAAKQLAEGMSVKELNRACRVLRALQERIDGDGAAGAGEE